MLRIGIVLFVLSVFSLNLASQAKFVSIYDFNGCGTKDINGNLGNISNSVLAQCDCGVDNEAIIMNSNSLELPLNIDSLFKLDFTICFDVLIENVVGEVDLLSKSLKCNSDTTIDISYRTKDSIFTIFLKEGNDESYILFAKADAKSCWQNVCLSIIGGDIRIYINGQEAANVFASDRLRLDNGVPLTFNSSDCQFNNLTALRGRLDRILFANYGFKKDEIRKYFIPQQKIITQDTIIFLGDQVQLRAVSNCPSGVNWSPSSTLNNSNILNPIASPIIDTKYSTFFNLGNCRINDSVLIRVVDKDKLQCEKISLPTAFTPNGDNLNEEYFISNPYLITKLNYFDILDRNGSLIFSTNDPLAKWDGTYKSKLLNPGTFYYRIEYECKNSTYKNRGSFFLMR
ncbi:MAG: gliding motility-associated C-terminal domain-containing protein [Saprospiraceae bacterium]